MFDALLKTKLFIPRQRPNLVPRSRLLARLDQGLRQGRALTLISAPAGFGKTTLAGEWLAGGKRPFAWLSLDERDGDLARFLSYVVAALQTVFPAPNGPAAAEDEEPSFGQRTLDMVESPQTAAAESILTALLNEIAALPEEFTLVLDDYHLVDTPAIDEALAFLLEHLPPQMHLTIITREDPPLPLPRLRVRGLLSELRASDLRFTAEETADFLNRVTALELTAEEVAVLERRTEGWIAGLQLAAIAMQSSPSTPDQPDAHQFIAAFAGDDRYVVDYLLEEVLQRRPEYIRRFLLQTSILKRLSGPLCAAVTGQEESGRLLEELERSNLFVVPLDNKRAWYRYHHLFADVLQVHLMKHRPEEIAALHRRAGEWYEQNGLTADAVHHVLAAGDYERAAGLIELAWPEMDYSRQSAAWLRWVRALPEALLHNRPVLNLGYAWALLATGRLEEGEYRLRAAETGLRASPEKLVIVDEERFQSLPVSIATIRAYHAQAVGDVAGTLRYARQAFDLIPAEDTPGRGRPAGILAMAYWSNGELETAAQILSEAMTNAALAGNAVFTITGTYVLAEILKGLGRLREAVRACRYALELAEEQSRPPRGTADVHVALAELFLEQGRLEEAGRHLSQSVKLGETAASPYCAYRLALAQARMAIFAGDFAEAGRRLDEAGRRYVRGPAPETRPVPALRANTWLAQGRTAEARRWVVEQAPAVDDDLSYLREFEHLTLARVLVAQFRQEQAQDSLEGAMRLLDRLLKAAEAGGRMGSVLEILVAQAAAQEARGSVSQALEPLQRALALAQAEGWVRVFVAGGRPAAALLVRLQETSEETRPFIRQLLAAFDRENEDRPPAVSSQPLLEPLSERELEVLHLVADGLSNREIAERLYLSLSTVKGHNRLIYGKLNVRRRTEAVARARELGLL